MLKTSPGERDSMQTHFFIENGGSFNYELIPHSAEHGLLEGATPECHGPTELLLYQRAQEQLLVNTMNTLNIGLYAKKGRIGLIKNCRDGEGNIYGAQENYEAEIASGVTLLLYRIILVSNLPILAVVLIFSWIVLYTSYLIIWLLVYFIKLFLRALDLLVKKCTRIIPLTLFKSLKIKVGKLYSAYSNKITYYEYNTVALNTLIYKSQAIFMPLLFIAYAVPIVGLRFIAFKKYKKALLSFIVTRSIYSGAGTIFSDNSFSISEKGSDIKNIARWTLLPSDRAIFDFGNIAKGLHVAFINVLLLRPQKLKDLFRKKQRLQLGLSDSNRAQIAEFLKIGTTLIVLDMIENNYLPDAPVIWNPKKSLKAIIHDPSLTCKVPILKGKDLSAIEIQSYFYNKAKAYLNNMKNVPIEYYEVVKIWGDVLKGLKKDPGSLFGRIDWITKQHLIKKSGSEDSFEINKKIDLAYHEIGYGYFDKLEKNKIAPTIVSIEEINKAITEPSSPDKVKIRSDFLKNVHYANSKKILSWDSVKINSWKSRKIIDFNNFKEKSNKK